MTKTKHIESLKGFIVLLTDAQKEDFANRCDTTCGYLNLVMYGVRKCSAILAINIDRESLGAVRCDDLCPDADFEYLRKQAIASVNNSKSNTKDLVQQNTRPI